MFSFLFGLLILIFFAVMGYFGWKYWQGNQNKQDSDIDKIIHFLPPLSLHLLPSSAKNWKSAEKLDEDEKKLAKVGAKQQGYYSGLIGEVAYQYSIWNFRNFITLVLSEKLEIQNELGLTQASYAMEAIVKLKGDSSMRVANKADSIGLPKNPYHISHFESTEDVVGLLKSAKAKIKDISLVSRVNDCKAFFVENYRVKSEWYWQEKQMLSNEMQVLLATSGVEVGEALMASLLYYTKFSLAESIHAQIMDRFPSQAKLTEEKWNVMRENVVIIHEKMPSTMLSAALYEILGMPTKTQEEALDKLEEEGFIPDPIKQFHNFYERWNLKYKAKCIAKTKTPVATEIYLRSS